MMVVNRDSDPLTPTFLSTLLLHQHLLPLLGRCPFRTPMALPSELLPVCL